MTFIEALNKKTEVGETYDIGAKSVGKVWVVPEIEDDLLRYANDYRISKFDDNSAKKYSSNSQFKVYAFWTDGVDVVYKNLSS